MTDIVTLKTYATNSRLTHAKPVNVCALPPVMPKQTPNWRRAAHSAAVGEGSAAEKEARNTLRK